MYQDEYRECGGDVSKMARFKPADPEHPERGFGIKDLAVYDDALQIVQHNIETLEKTCTGKEVIFVEFARNDYQTAFRKFSPDFLKDSRFLFLESDTDTCINRMKNKHGRVYNKDTIKSNHAIPDDVMRGYYGRSSWEYMTDPAGFRKDFPVPEDHLLTSRNEGTIEELYQQIDNLFLQAGYDLHLMG
jgi:hypothetical protein